MEHERSECEEKLFGNDGTKRKLFIRRTVKTKTLVQSRRKLQTSVKEAGLITSCDLYALMQNTAISSFILNKTGRNNILASWTFRCPTKFPMSYSRIFSKIC